MSNLVDYAKDELKKIGMIDSGEPYNDLAAKAILDLIELFDSQDHSGFSAPYVINAFSRLAMFKPLSPLTGEDDKWNEVGTGVFQNKRYSAVEEQLDYLIENANKEENRERFKALKVLAKYHKPSQISSSIDYHADGRYDLTIELGGCCRRF
jgi:hypothetical protein